MSFSIRNLFQRGSDAAPGAEQEVMQPFAIQGTPGTAFRPASSPPTTAMQATTAMPTASPFQAGGSPLFRTAGNEAVEAPPINSTGGLSPFSLPSAAPTNMPLTVGDVVGLLPPELVRGGALQADQAITLPPALIEGALRSGQAAIPVFEIYRVCPALFQTPVSPQDPRMVPLPAAKLPSLIAAARTAANGSAPPPSPFSQAAATQPPAQPGPSPFSAVGGASPPSPFPMSPFAAAMPANQEPEPLSGTLPAAPASPLSRAPSPPAAASPFSAAAAPPPPPVFGASPFQAAASPFAPPPEPAQPAPSPFSSATPPGQGQEKPANSPFAASPFSASAPPAQPPAMTAGPAASASPAQAHAVPPAPAWTPPSPPAFSTPFAAFSSPTPPAPAAAPETSFTPPPASPPAPNPAPTAAGGKVRLGLSSILSGYSLEELGFNPTSIPAWLQTTLDSSALRDQIGGGTVMLELGALIDGVSDIGFRNMLTGAKRDFPVKLPPNEVFHALTAAEAPGAPGPSALPAMVAAPKPASSTMVIQPGPAAAPMEPPPPAPAPVSAFAPPVSHPAPVSAAPPPASTAPPAFSPFPAAPSESRTLFEARQQAPQPPPAQETGMAGLFTPPTATKQLQPAPPEPAAPASGLLQPKPGVFSAFGSAPAAPAPHVFDPFGSAAPSAPPAAEAGFTSAQLLGQQPSPASTTLLPAPHAKPLSDPFAKPAVPPAAPVQPFIPENPAPSSFFAPPSQQAESRPPAPVADTPTRPAFGSATVPLASLKTPPPAFPPAPEARPAAAPASAAQPAPATSPIRHSFLGLNPLDTQTDQLLLRALLGTEASLDASSVVRLLATQPGLSACVCLHGSSVLSHGDPAQPDAATFQQQAAEIARQVRGLAPLIGITEAETFTLNAGGRLITFCFPGSITLGVLHAGEPSNGLRDKITLVARELARMLG